jgi:hypothetical protein
MWRQGCRTATQREARQPISSSSNAGARAKIISTAIEPMMLTAVIGLKHMSNFFLEICLVR